MTTLTRVSLQATPLTPSFGSVVEDIPLSGDLPHDVIGEIRSLLVDRKVLFFPGQHHLTPADHVGFAARFGALTASHPVMPSYSAEFPQIWQIDSTKPGAKNDAWHTDVTFVARPPAASVLRAIRIPTVGGDTLWADQEAAYEALSRPMQLMIDSLFAEHDGNHEFAGTLAQSGGNDWEGRHVTRLDPVVHPVVRVHPESGRKGLFVNPWFTQRIVGVSATESRGILDALFAVITRPDAMVKHRWQPGDVVFWDNRSTVHYAVEDYGSFRRVMHRVTVTGDVPQGPTPAG